MPYIQPSGSNPIDLNLNFASMGPILNTCDIVLVISTISS